MLQRNVEFSHVHKNVSERVWDFRCGNCMVGSKYKPDTNQSEPCRQRKHMQVCRSEDFNDKRESIFFELFCFTIACVRSLMLALMLMSLV